MAAAARDQRVRPAFVGETDDTDEAGGGEACFQYEDCCEDYVDALSEVDGLEGAADAAEATCDGISDIAELPGGNDACQQALDAMKQAMALYASMPGFDVPSSCQ